MIFEHQECELSLRGSSGSRSPTKLHQYQLQAGQMGFQAHWWCWQDSVLMGAWTGDLRFSLLLARGFPQSLDRRVSLQGSSQRGSWLPSEPVNERARQGKSDGSRSLFVTCSQKWHGVVCWILFIRIKWLNPACALDFRRAWIQEGWDHRALH